MATSAFAADKGPLKAGALIDINTASAAELRMLPDIGEPRSNAIISNRPYKKKEDLLTKKIVSAPVYDKIKDNVVATGSVKNSALPQRAMLPIEGMIHRTGATSNRATIPSRLLSGGG